MSCQGPCRRQAGAKKRPSLGHQEYTGQSGPDFGQKPVFGSCSNAATVSRAPPLLPDTGAAAASVLRTMQGGTRWFGVGVYLDSCLEGGARQVG